MLAAADANKGQLGALTDRLAYHRSSSFFPFSSLVVSLFLHAWGRISPRLQGRKLVLGGRSGMLFHPTFLRLTTQHVEETGAESGGGWGGCSSSSKRLLHHHGALTWAGAAFFVCSTHITYIAAQRGSSSCSFLFSHSIFMAVPGRALYHFVILLSKTGRGKKIRRDAMEVLAVSNLPPIITWDTDCISRTVNENLHTIKSRTKLSMTNVISPCLEVIAALSNNPFVDPAASLTKQVSLLKQPTTYFPPAAHRWRSCIGQPMPHAIRYSINTRVCACCAGRLH